MKNIVTLKVILLVFSVILSSESIAAEQILPLPKPTVDEKTKIKALKKKRDLSSEKT